jgi:hypothetical protein
MADADKKTLIAKLLSDPDAGGVKKTKRTPKSAKVSFVEAMGELGYTSVFDIVRESKSTFVTRLAARTDADGDLAYDNAQCYAAQIARSWREHQVSSDRRQIATARTGIRSLVDVGPSFPNLFKENWDQFCKVGAIAAVDSPVAYLNSLYSFLLREIEDQGGSDAIPLSVRRPDIPSLMLDAQSTFTPVPMLKIVTDVLGKGIQEYLDAADHPDKDKPVHELLKTKRHPFTFPYDFHHQQIMLGLSGKKQPTLGELSYRASQLLPVHFRDGIDTVDPDNSYGSSADNAPSNAQILLSGLSGEQQQLLTAPSLFTTFYLCQDDLKSTWRSSTCHLLVPWHCEKNYKGFVVPDQDGVADVDPQASSLQAGATGSNEISVNDTARNLIIDITIAYSAHDNVASSPQYINSLRYAADCLSLVVSTPQGAPQNACASFYVIFTAEAPIDGVAGRQHIASQSFTISTLEDSPDNDCVLTDEQRDYFYKHYGVTVNSCTTNGLVNVSTFLKSTDLTAAQLSALLALHEHRPRFSENVVQSNRWVHDFPYSMNYGACYVNGTGGWEVGSRPFVRTTMSDPSIGIEHESSPDGTVVQYLTNTSLNRFDRLQRMIRLQKWTGIPFAELDTLMMAVIHSEGDSNLAWELNGNTLRALGVYRYLSNRYVIKPEEFAAFMHFLTAFASGDRMPLFDKVFNSPALFDTPLILDGATFSAVDPDADSQKTIAQLCVGLGIAATDDEFGQMARDTALLLGPPNDGGPVTVALKRTQAFISSFYRQARIAQLFGLSFKDSRALIDLLGGQVYLKRVVSGYVRGIGEATEHADILDILMQMDWAVGWLVETRRDVGTLRVQLGVDADSAPANQALLDQLNQMGKDLVDVLLTREQMDALNLPNATKGSPAAPFDWWTEALSDSDVRDASGLVRTVPTDKLEDPATYLAGKINAHLTGITFSGEVDQQAVLERVQIQLLGFVMAGRARQLRLFEGLFQSLSGLSVDCTELVMRVAHTGGGASMLSALIPLTASGASLSFPLSTNAMAFVEKIQSVVRCAEVVQPLGVSASALLTFSSHPTWLWRDAQELTLTLKTLFGFDRYNLWVKQAQFPEERLLDYFRAANAAGADANKCAALLAQLIGWSAGEVKVVTASLNGVAKSMADVDWARRVQATCTESGLSATAVLQATKLTADSPSHDWQFVGEAAMAANR